MSSSRTSIAWTDRTWNPTRGCRRVSPGCERCYAERQAYRFSQPTKKTPKPPYQGLVRLGTNGPTWTGRGKLVASALEEPRSWKRPQRVFVDSMSDLFFEAFSNEEIAAVFGVMAGHPHLTFQVLTKRAKRMRAWFDWVESQPHVDPIDVIVIEAANRADVDQLNPPWPLKNVWLGVSVESQSYANDRIPDLLRTSAAVRFVSYEPALERVDFANIADEQHAQVIDALAFGLDWIIVGGESGPRSRPFDLAWAREVVEQCAGTSTRVFIKQMGSNVHDSMRSIVGGWSPGDPEPNTRLRLKNRKGEDPGEWPEGLRRQEFPNEVRT